MEVEINTNNTNTNIFNFFELKKRNGTKQNLKISLSSSAIFLITYLVTEWMDEFLRYGNKGQ